MLSQIFLCNYGAKPAASPPTAPTSLVATPNANTSVGLSWTLGTGQASQQIYRSADGGSTWKLVAPVSSTATTYTDSTAAGNTNYIYRVKGVNAGGSSSYATASSILTYPAAPTSLTATPASSSEIDLTWLGSATTFNIYSHDSSTTTFSSVGTSSGPMFANTGLTASTLYTYKVDGTNATGTGAFSATTSAATPGSPPATPTDLTAGTVSSTEIDIFWDASSGATGYVLESSPDNSTWTPIFTGSDTSYANTGLSPSTEYYYHVKATNGAGSSAYSASANATTYSSDQNAIQLVSFAPPVSDGDFSLVFDGQTTADISAATGNAAAVQADLEALSNIGSGNVAVTGDWTSGYSCEFQNALGGQPIDDMTVGDNTLVSPDNTISVTTTTPGSPAGTPVYAWPFATDGSETVDSNPATVTGGSFTGTAFQLDGLAPDATASDADFPQNGSPFSVQYYYTASSDDLSNGLSGAVWILAGGPNSPYETAWFGIRNGQWWFCSGNEDILWGTADTNPHAFLFSYDGASVSLTLDGVNLGAQSVTSNFVQTGSFYFGGNPDYQGAPYFNASGLLSNVQVSSGDSGTLQVDQIALDSNASGTFAIGSTTGISSSDDGTGVQTGVDALFGSGFATVALVSAGVWSVTYTTPGDMSTYTAMLLSACNTDGNDLTQPVTISITTTQPGG